MNETAIAFLDVDDVLLDFFEPVRLLVREFYGTELADDALPSTWSGEDFLPEGVTFADFFEMADRVHPGWNRNFKPFLWTLPFLKQLESSRIRRVLVSNSWDPVGRIQNLADQKVPYDELFCIGLNGPKKAAYITALLQRYPAHTPWVFVDDNLDNCLQVLRNTPLKDCRGVVCIDYPYNRPFQLDPLYKHLLLQAEDQIQAYGYTLQLLG